MNTVHSSPFPRVILRSGRKAIVHFGIQPSVGHFLMGVAFSILTALSTQGATFNIANGDVAALRTAIHTANHNAEDDTIILATNGSYVFNDVDTTPDGGEVSALPTILRDGDHNIIINGNGATVARNAAPGTPEFRLLVIANRPSVATISRVTFANGKTTPNFRQVPGVALCGPPAMLFSTSVPF